VSNQQRVKSWLLTETIDLFGDTYLGIDELCRNLNQRAIRNGIFELTPNPDSEKMGFLLTPKSHVSVHGLPGFYCIFKDKVLEYVGMTESSIGNRISRFVKEVNGCSRFDEDHPAGILWRTQYGLGNFDGCKVMFADYYLHEANDNLYTYKQIEKQLIRIHKPRLNRG